MIMMNCCISQIKRDSMYAKKRTINTFLFFIKKNILSAEVLIYTHIHIYITDNKLKKYSITEHLKFFKQNLVCLINF